MTAAGMSVHLAVYSLMASSAAPPCPGVQARLRDLVGEAPARGDARGARRASAPARPGRGDARGARRGAAGDRTAGNAGGRGHGGGRGRGARAQDPVGGHGGRARPPPEGDRLVTSLANKAAPGSAAKIVAKIQAAVDEGSASLDQAAAALWRSACSGNDSAMRAAGPDLLEGVRRIAAAQDFVPPVDFDGDPADGPEAYDAFCAAKKRAERFALMAGAAQYAGVDVTRALTAFAPEQVAASTGALEALAAAGAAVPKDFVDALRAAAGLDGRRAWLVETHLVR